MLTSTMALGALLAGGVLAAAAAGLWVARQRTRIPDGVRRIGGESWALRGHPRVEISRGATSWTLAYRLEVRTGLQIRRKQEVTDLDKIDIRMGDQAFDRLALVQGEPAAAFRWLGPEARKTLQAVIVAGGRLQSETLLLSVGADQLFAGAQALEAAAESLVDRGPKGWLSDASEVVAQAVHTLGHTTAEIEKLARHPEPRVRSAVVRHTHDQALLTMLLSDPVTEVSDRARGQLVNTNGLDVALVDLIERGSDDGLRKVLALSKPSAAVREALAKRSQHLNHALIVEVGPRLLQLLDSEDACRQAVSWVSADASRPLWEAATNRLRSHGSSTQILAALSCIPAEMHALVGTLRNARAMADFAERFDLQRDLSGVSGTLSGAHITMRAEDDRAVVTVETACPVKVRGGHKPTPESQAFLIEKGEFAPWPHALLRLDQPRIDAYRELTEGRSLHITSQGASLHTPLSTAADGLKLLLAWLQGVEDAVPRDRLAELASEPTARVIQLLVDSQASSLTSNHPHVLSQLAAHPDADVQLCVARVTRNHAVLTAFATNSLGDPARRASAIHTLHGLDALSVALFAKLWRETDLHTALLRCLTPDHTATVLASPPELHKSAVQALVGLAEPVTTPLLLRGLSGPHAELILTALADFGTADAYPAVARIAEDKANPLRHRAKLAAMALRERLGSEGAVSVATTVGGELSEIDSVRGRVSEVDQ